MDAYVEKDGDRYRTRWTDPTTGKPRSKRHDMKRDAVRMRDDINQATRVGAHVDPGEGKMPYGIFVRDEWWPTRATKAASTRARDASYMNNHVLPVFGRTALSQITQPMVAAWMADLQGRVSAETAVKAYQLFGRSLRAAKAAKRISYLPLDEIELPRIEHKEMMILEPPQCASLHAAMPEFYRPLVSVGLYCGLRIGELAGLRVARIDFLKRRIRVVESLSDVAGYLEFKTPKTKAGVRTVPAPASVIDELAEYVQGLGSDDLVFTGEKGGPLRVSNFRRRVWTPAVESVGCDGFRIHDMRHTAVSNWINLGADAKQVAVWAGHRSVATVFDRYGHLWDDRGDEVMDRLDATIINPQGVRRTRGSGRIVAVDG